MLKYLKEHIRNQLGIIFFQFNSLILYKFKGKRKKQQMYSQENANDCENFIQEVLQTNHFLTMQFRQKDQERYADQKTLQSQAPTNSRIIQEVQSSKIQKQSTSKSKSQTCIGEQLIRRGHWGEDENRKYHWFLELYYKHFICKEKRRFDRIFKTMSLFIGSRQAEQCRSHHQKMQKKYHSFCNILLFLRKMHFKDESTAGLEKDLRENNIAVQEHLLSQIQLHQICSKKGKSNNPTNSKQKSKQKKDSSQVQKQKQKQKINFLDIKIETQQKVNQTLNKNNKSSVKEQKYQKQNNLQMEMFLQISKQKQKQDQFGYKLYDFLDEDYQHRLSFDHFIV